MPLQAPSEDEVRSASYGAAGVVAGGPAGDGELDLIVGAFCYDGAAGSSSGAAFLYYGPLSASTLAAADFVLPAYNWKNTGTSFLFSGAGAP